MLGCTLEVTIQGSGRDEFMHRVECRKELGYNRTVDFCLNIYRMWIKESQKRKWNVWSDMIFVLHSDLTVVLALGFEV